MERGDHEPGRPLRGGHEPAHAVAHLARGLVRERDREDVLRGHPALEQVRDAVRHHARLAGARPCEHEQRSVAVEDRRALRLVEGGRRHGGRIIGGSRPIVKRVGREGRFPGSSPFR
jgi:hypothetical protein